MYTSAQRSWMRTLLKMKRATRLVPLDIPDNPFIKRVWLLANSPVFTNFYTCVILFNLVLMATEHYDQPEWYEQLAVVINIVLLCLYILEIIIKIVSTIPRVRFYFLDFGNLFDLMVVGSSVIDLILSSGGGKSGLQALRVLRVIRVFRTLRFVRRSPRLMVMVNTMAASIPGILAVMMFLGLQIFIFAILGNQFFSGLKYGTALHRRNNFDTPWDAMITLFVVLTGDGWVKMKNDVGIQAPMCTTQEQVDAMREEHLVRYGKVFFNDPLMDTSDCGSRVGSTVYFDLFYFLGFQFLRSLFIAGMMENFFAFKSSGNFVLADGHIEGFRRKWRAIDVDGKGYISAHELRALCKALVEERNPLGAVPLANEFKYEMVRTELIRQAKKFRQRQQQNERARIEAKIKGMRRREREAAQEKLDAMDAVVRNTVMYVENVQMY